MKQTRHLLSHYDGFTLVEFVLVMIVLGIVSAFVTTRMPDQKSQLDAIGHQLARHIHLAQSFAMQRRQRYRINFFSDHYRVSDQTNTIGYTFPTHSAPDISLGNRITLSSTNAFIVFDSTGAPYSDAGTPGTLLAANAVITLTGADGNHRILTVSPETGMVTIT